MNTMPYTLPEDHPQRRALNDEVHARPPESLTAPVRLSYLVIMGGGSHASDLQGLTDLIEGTGAPKPSSDTNHYVADLGTCRVRWERHTEFVRYTFIATGAEKIPFSQPAMSLVPYAWANKLQGKTLAAIHASVIPGSKPPDPVKTGERFFSGNPMIGSSIAGGAGRAYTDFRIHADGFGRLLVCDHRMNALQSGRLVQRLFEIDTYRMMALLALPMARQLSPFLNTSEQELLQILAAMETAGEIEEPQLLDRITKLEAAVARKYTDPYYRFSAANAYYELVQQRIEELREERIEGLQTFREFNDRRFLPAIATCRAVAGRLAALSDRIAHATVLLSTRVSVTRERQNQNVLQSMDRRADLQLRLQQTVEGLSVAAITYYIVGLVYYAAKGFLPHEGRWTPEQVAAAAIPIALALVAWGLRRFRNSLHKSD
jgi:uncharacterized membrane-anchored protein